MFKSKTRKALLTPTPRRGVTIIEVMVVTTVIAMLAAVSFPIYKIIQQREKEKRVKDILLVVRAAISGSKTARSNKLFTQGYRNFVITRGISEIEDENPGASAAPIANFLASGTTCNGRLNSLYPQTPSDLIRATNYTVYLATDTDGTANTDTAKQVSVEINRRFLRHIPPHPFISWYPNAHWEFKPVKIAAGGPTFASSATDPWNSGTATGVIDIVSRGAGIALDGSNTDDW